MGVELIRENVEDLNRALEEYFEDTVKYYVENAWDVLQWVVENLVRIVDTRVVDVPVEPHIPHPLMKKDVEIDYVYEEDGEEKEETVHIRISLYDVTKEFEDGFTPRISEDLERAGIPVESIKRVYEVYAYPYWRIGRHGDYLFKAYLLVVEQ